MHRWLQMTLAKLSSKSAVAVAIRYALSRWAALLRFCEGGRLEIDNNSAERALRAVAIGRKNYLFAGADSGGELAAAMYNLTGTAKLNGLDFGSLSAICVDSDCRFPISRIGELLPWNVVDPASITAESIGGCNGALIEMRQTINWVPIDSRALAAAAYVAPRRWLYLRFHSGETYRYFDFPPQQYRDFLDADSKGTYFGKHIRNHFTYEHLPRSRYAGR